MKNSLFFSCRGFLYLFVCLLFLIDMPVVAQGKPGPGEKSKRFSYPQELQEFVSPTELCDADHPDIQSKARELALSAKTPRDAALAVFYFVRDSCVFGLSQADEKASETLKSRVGWCITKTNLEVTLLRALGIPARYHQIWVTKKSLKGITSGLLYSMVPEPVEIHPYCECYLDGKWIACEVTFDKKTFLAGQAKGIFAAGDPSLIDWDGRSDCNWVTSFMLKDVGTHSSYDNIAKQVATTNRKMGPASILNWVTNHSNRKTARLRQRY
jgi:transglutaminase-like putative cysteine protease